MIVCIDSSFLVSCYVPDAHSAESDRRRITVSSICITPLNQSEFAHAIHHYVFRSQMSLAHANSIWNSFDLDRDKGPWNQVGLPERVWDASINLAGQYGPTIGTRTLDSLHVACALQLGADRFWTFDERQRRLAEAVGLNTGP